MLKFQISSKSLKKIKLKEKQKQKNKKQTKNISVNRLFRNLTDYIRQ